MARISVFGIGYVGVVSAACLARDGHQVIAVDVEPGKVEAINAGLSPIVENGLDALIAQVVGDGKLSATDDVQHAIDNSDVSFIAVGTPSAPDGSVGLTYVETACRNIGAAMAKKQGYHSVVIRSTSVETAGGLKAARKRRTMRSKMRWSSPLRPLGLPWPVGMIAK